ncbi:MAG TPA: ComEA family DNA-binding protein [Candidatus Saccharimonadales bacterium]|jgi:competence protein ComEA|nr:ComEA family DNA-binding protein [Candidatus Saccharimonadales bacterium]
MENLFLKYRYPLLIFIVGLTLTACGLFFSKSGLLSSPTKVEVLQATTSGQISGEITVEIAGEVLSPGVYKLPRESRVDDLLVAAGGFSADADRGWTDKYLNRAAKLTDGQKVYIPPANQQIDESSAKSSGGYKTVSSDFSSDSNNLVNINTASSAELDSLPGIGPVYAQNIIEHRPYSTSEELVSKGAIKQSLYDKIKDKISVY